MSEWLSTRTKGKRKRSVGQDAVAATTSETESQDVLGMKPLKRSRVASIVGNDLPAVSKVIESKAKVGEDEATAASHVDQLEGLGSLRPGESDELLYFIEHNYLSSLSALMHSLKDLLFVSGAEGSDDGDLVERIKAEFNRLRGVKEGIVRKATRRTNVNNNTGSAPGTPKKKRSAYQWFAKEQYYRIKDEHPAKTYFELLPILSTSWFNLTDEEKAPYVQKAAQALQGQAAAAKSETPHDGPAQKRLTAWHVFFSEQLAERKDTGLTRQELSRAIGNDWKNMSEDERKKYAALAQERSSQPPTPRTPRSTPAVFGWHIFRNEQGKILLKERPGITPADRLKELHARWDALTDEQRADYREMAEIATEEKKSAAAHRGSTHLSSGTIGKDEGAVVIRSKRLTTDAFLSLTKIPTVVLVDITIRSTSPYRKFAYAYPVGGIPVPLGRKEAFGMSVEGIMEGLKVFEEAGVDRGTLSNQSMKSLRRTEKKHGKLLGWSKGLKGHSDGDPLLDEEAARWQILFPAYKYVLEECLAKEVAELKAMIEKGNQLVLLDMENSVDVYDYSRPVSAAELLRRYLLDQWPSRAEERKLKEGQPEASASSKGKEKRGHEGEDKVHWDSQVSLGEEDKEEESSQSVDEKEEDQSEDEDQSDEEQEDTDEDEDEDEDEDDEDDEEESD